MRRRYRSLAEQKPRPPRTEAEEYAAVIQWLERKIAPRHRAAATSFRIAGDEEAAAGENRIADVLEAAVEALKQNRLLAPGSIHSQVHQARRG